MNTTPSLLSGGTTQQPRVPGPNDRIAEAMYPEAKAYVPEVPNAAVAAVRAADGPARVLYPAAKQYGKPLLRELSLATNPEGSETALAQQAVELAEVAADIGFDRNDLASLAAAAAAFKAKPPTAEEQAAYRRTAVSELRAQYGKGFTEAMDAASALAQRDPRFKQYLNRTGLANHPWAVLRLAELGLRAKTRGRL